MKQEIKVIRNGKWTTIPNTLEALQDAVGGYIETVTLFEGVVMIVDEEGRLKGKRPTCKLMNEVIVGDWLLVGANRRGEFTDLPANAWRCMRGMEVIKEA